MFRQQFVLLTRIGIGLGAKVVTKQLVRAHRRIDQRRAAAVLLAHPGRHKAAEGAAHSAKLEFTTITTLQIGDGLLDSRPGRRWRIGLGRNDHLDVGPVGGHPGSHLLRLGGAR